MITKKLRQHEVTLMHDAADLIDELVGALGQAAAALENTAKYVNEHTAHAVASDAVLYEATAARAALAKAKGAS